eukprot:jgi/Botrbrau1/5931/Bobra.0366s0105.1
MQEVHQTEVKVANDKLNQLSSQLQNYIKQVVCLEDKIGERNDALAEAEATIVSLRQQYTDLDIAMQSKIAKLEEENAKEKQQEEEMLLQISSLNIRLVELESQLSQEKDARYAEKEALSSEKQALEEQASTLTKQVSLLSSKHILDLKQQGRDFEKKMSDFVDKADKEHQKQVAGHEKALLEEKARNAARVAELEQQAKELVETVMEYKTRNQSLLEKSVDLEERATASASKLEEISACIQNEREASAKCHMDALQHLKDDFENALQLKEKELTVIKKNEERLAGLIAKLKEEVAEQLDCHNKQNKVTADLLSTLKQEVQERNQAAENASQQIQQLEGDLKGTRAKFAEALSNLRDTEATLKEKLVQINVLEGHLHQQDEAFKEQAAHLCQVQEELAEKTTLLQRISMAAAPDPTPITNSARKRQITTRSEVPPAKRMKRNVHPMPPRFARCMATSPKLMVEGQAAQDADGEEESCEEVSGTAQVISTKLLKGKQSYIPQTTRGGPNARNIAGRGNRGRRTLLGSMSIQTLAEEEQGACDTEDDGTNCGPVPTNVHKFVKPLPFQHFRGALVSPHGKVTLRGGSAVLDIFGKASLESYALQSPLEKPIAGTT